MKKQKGFTLIELIAVIILLGIITAAGIAQFNAFSSNDTLRARDDVIAGLVYAQQVAMARDSASNPITFRYQASQFSVLENGGPLQGGAVSYPVVLPNTVVISNPGTLNYNKLGQSVNALGQPITTTINIVGADGVTPIVVQGSGYANY